MAPSPAPADVLDAVDALGLPGTPVTTPEVAEGFDCTQRTIYNRLDSLADDGILRTKKVGANSRVWWRPVSGDARPNGGPSTPDVPVSLRDGRAAADASGEMAERIRAFEWADTPLGPVEEWPAELRVAVDIMLGADEAIGLYWGADLVLLYNDAAREQIGKKHPDALGRPAREVFPEAWETLGPMHEQVVAGEGPVRVEEQYLPLERGDDLEDVWFDSSFNPIPCADGSVGGVFNVSVDVTDRVRAESALRERQQESERRYRTVLNSMDEGFFLADVVFDKDGEPLDIFYRDSNPAATELVGEKFEGRWLSEIDTGYEDHWYEVFGRVASTGEGERHELYVEPDGIWYDFYVFKPEEAGPRRVAVVFEDVTERKEAEVALRENEQRLRLATDIANIAVFEWDLETASVRGNERMNELFGYDESEPIVGEELLEERIHPEDLESVTDQLEAAFEPASDGKYEFEFRARRPDGSERWVRTNGEVFFEGNGDDRRAVRVFGTGIDITERKEMEEDLRESKERQSYLLELNDALHPLTDPAAIQAEACRVLGEHLDVKRAQYGELHLDRGVIDITRDYYRGGQHVDELPSLVGEYDFDDFPAHAAAWLDHRSLVVNDAERDAALSESERTGMAQRAVRATLSTPLVKNGEPVVVMAVTSSVPRGWTERDAALLEETADRTWNAVQRARAERELAVELETMKELQEVSTRSVEPDDEDVLYDTVLDTAVDMLDAEFGSLQRLDPEANELELLANQGFTEAAESAWERVTTDHASTCRKALQTGERVVVSDVETNGFMAGTDDRESYLQTGIRAVQTTPLVSRDGDVLGMLSTHWAEPYEPSERDRHVLDVLARQIADLLQQRAAYGALEASEERYRSLFEEMEEGFALCELVRDADGRVSDMRYLELNEAFEDLTGVDQADAEGRLVTEVFPGQGESLFEQYVAVAETGEPERFENYAPSLDRWYEIRIYPRGGDVFAVLYDDITERKRREQHDQFLLELGDEIRTLTDEEEIGAVCTDLLAEQLGLDRSYFVRFDADAEEALVGPEHHGDGLDPVSGLYPFSAFPEAIQQIHEETPVYDDVANDPTLPEVEQQALLELDFGAWVGVPIRTDDANVDWALYAVHSEAHDWTDAEVSLIEEVAERTWTAVERARAEQALSESNRSLERLNDALRELLDADPETVHEGVAEHVVEILDVDYAALWRYDHETGDVELDSDHSGAGANIDAVRPLEASREQVWETFVGDEMDVENALDIADDGAWPSALGSRALVPLGRHGVVCVGSTDTETFGDRLVDLVQMVASSVETVWDRAESEAALASQNEELQRLDRLNRLIRRIDQALVGAETVEGLYDDVCRQLADSSLYEFAWVGTHDAVTDAIEPRAWAGVDSEYVEDVSATGDAAIDGPNPVGTALRSGTLQVVSDVVTASEYAMWREATLTRGARSLVSIPLVYEDAQYGVLTVYADRPNPDDRDLEVLDELGSTIAHTINARETVLTRQTNLVTELTLRFTDAGTPLSRLSRQADCRLAFEGFVPQVDGEVDVFFTVESAATETVSAAGDRVLSVVDLDCLSERPETSLFRARVDEEDLVVRLVEGGAVVRGLTYEAGDATATVDLEESSVVRAFVDDLREQYGTVELFARQPRERPLKTRRSFVDVVRDDLTARQLEILETAYLSGYFDTPRTTTGQEITAFLDISQPTFSQHLRAAERSVFGLLFREAEDQPSPH